MSENPKSDLPDKIRKIADKGFDEWVEEHLDPKIRMPKRGRLYGALIVLANIEEGDWAFSDLGNAKSTDRGKFFSDRSIYRHTDAHIRKITDRHGKSHLFSSGEFGRTSTGTKRAGLEFIQLIHNSLENGTKGSGGAGPEGLALISHLFHRVFELLQAYYDLGGIEAKFMASESIATYLTKVINSHGVNPGAVLQHLVGAKLALRFGELKIIHHSSSAADMQTGRLGDFEIGSAVFHVTKRANDGHYRKALQNADNGRTVYLLIPSEIQEATRKYADQLDPQFSSKINVFSVEQFVAQNLDELAFFDRLEALKKFERLLSTYNVLIDEHENDSSLRVIIPDFGI